MQIIDATDLVLGRMCSEVAKRIMRGEELIIVNAENAVISGKKSMLIARYKNDYSAGAKNDGPFWPKRPDLFVKRAIRGMVPWNKFTGREAFKRVKAYLGVPDEYKGMEFTTFETAKAADLGTLNRIKVGDLCKQIGWSS